MEVTNQFTRRIQHLRLHGDSTDSIDVITGSAAIILEKDHRDDENGDEQGAESGEHEKANQRVAKPA